MCGKCSNYSDDEFHVCLMLILSCAMISVSSEFLDTDIYIYKYYIGFQLRDKNFF